MANFSTRNNFNGASFDYENGACKASGEFRYVESNLNSVNINGNYTKSGSQYNFWASRDMNGNLNLNGVPAAVIVDVATEVAAIVAKIEALNSAE
jgi:hypothetical protein